MKMTRSEPSLNDCKFWFDVFRFTESHIPIFLQGLLWKNANCYVHHVDLIDNVCMSMCTCPLFHCVMPSSLSVFASRY